MATKIRLMRFGAKRQPSYRVIVCDSRCPRDGRFVELLGSYNPRSGSSAVQMDAERAREWLRIGAQPTDGAREVLRMAGVLPDSGGRHEGSTRAPAQASERAPAAGRNKHAEPGGSQPR